MRARVFAWWVPFLCACVPASAALAPGAAPALTAEPPVTAGRATPESDVLESDDVVSLAAEFEPVARVLVAWPNDSWNHTDYFSTLIREAQRHAVVSTVVRDADQQAMVTAALLEAGVNVHDVEFIRSPLDTIWIRDYGPLVGRTRTGGVRLFDLPYDLERQSDDALPSALAGWFGAKRTDLPIGMQGGHFQSDGKGRCVISDDVFAMSADDGIPESEVRHVLTRLLPCRQLTVVPALLDEETGHLDIFVYLTGPRKALVGAYEPGEDDENAAVLDRAAAALTADGFRVRRVPMPGNEGRRVFRSYTNAIAINGVVLVPVFDGDDRFEDEALDIYADEMPGRDIVPVLADEMVELAGAVHCTTLTMP